MRIEIKKTYWPNTKMDTERSYLNGRKHGVQKEYYRHGQLCFEYSIINGQWHGLNQEWDPDGTRNLIGKYKRNFYNGPKIIFHYGNNN